jgi:hypothetical protein
VLVFHGAIGWRPTSHAGLTPTHSGPRTRAGADRTDDAHPVS